MANVSSRSIAEGKDASSGSPIPFDVKVTREPSFVSSFQMYRTFFEALEKIIQDHVSFRYYAEYA